MSELARLPQLVAFDLDYTLWDLWIDTHVTGPLRREKDTLNEVMDRNGDTIAFYSEVPQILHHLRDTKVIVAACSRTSAPALAFKALSLLLVPPPNNTEQEPLPAINFFNELEIYPGSKLKHFKAIHERTSVPYEEMLFFDDERRNAEVEQLGRFLDKAQATALIKICVTFVHVPNGLNSRLFDKGLQKWRGRMQEV